MGSLSCAACGASLEPEHMSKPCPECGATDRHVTDIDQAVATEGFNVKVRMNFSLYHMMASCGLARRSGQVEEEHKGEAFGPFYDEITINVAPAIIMSAASIEAFIN